MEYTVHRLAELSGVSARTLRFYDGIDLLKPARVTEAGYRIYGPAEAELLRQILIYRELGLPLDEIRRIVSSPGFDPKAALRGHLRQLLEKRERLDRLIDNVKKSIKEKEGLAVMTDSEKFEGLKRELISENERKFGTEIRGKYGDEAVDASNRKLGNMTQEQYDEFQRLSQEIDEALRAAVKAGDPGGAEATRLCELHKRWLCFHWSEYTPQAHAGLGEMYVEDARFKAYYDKVTPGGTVFLRDALRIFTGIGA